MPQATIHHDELEVQLTYHGDNIPDVISYARMLRKMLMALVRTTYRKLMEAKLKEELGKPYQQGNAFSAARHACPRCASKAANRHSFRSRQVAVPHLGKIQIERPLVRCRNCGRSYHPFDQEIGLEPYTTYTRRALGRPLEEVVHATYRKGATTFAESPSPMTLWRRVTREQPPVGVPAGKPPAGTCVVDGTRIPARAADQQHSVTIAHAVRRGVPRYNRPTFNRTVVALRVGSEKDIKPDLESAPIRTLVHDGKMELEQVAKQVGRCRWHVPHTVRAMLYRDGITGAENKRLTSEVSDLVFDETAGTGPRHEHLLAWANDNEKKTPSAASHVRRAAEGLAVYETDAGEDFGVETTSPAEREMRRINRRFENGGQWSQHGLDALLHYHQIYHHHPDLWDQWFIDCDEAPTSKNSQP